MSNRVSGKVTVRRILPKPTMTAVTERNILPNVRHAIKVVRLPAVDIG